MPDQSPNADRPSFPETSSSLLRGLRQASPEAWQRARVVYAPLVWSLCRGCRLQTTDCENVVQEVFMAVARNVANFERRGDGSFRAWLCTITGNKIRDHFRRKGKEPPAIGGSDFQKMVDGKEQESSGSSSFAAPMGKAALMRRVMDLVRPEFMPTTWQAFVQTTIEGRAAPEVAAVVGLSVNAVRLAKSRVLRRLRQVWDELEESLAEPPEKSSSGS